MGVARAGEPEQRHRGPWQPEERFPDLAVKRVVAQGAHIVVGRAVEAAAAVDGNAEGEARIDADDGRGDDAAPRDAADADAGGVDFGPRAEQGVSEDDVRDGVIHPLVGQRRGGVAVGAGARGAGGGVALPLRARRGAGDALIGLPLDGERDCGEALLVPLLHPLFERGAAAAVDEHDARDLAGARGGQAEPGEDARGFSLIREAVEEEGLEGAGGRDAGGGVDGGRRGQIGEGGDLGAQAGEVGRGGGGVGEGAEGAEGGEQGEAAVHWVGLRRRAWRLALSGGPSTRETATVWRPGVLKVSRPKEWAA